jgi:hypothetical protein
VSHEGIKCLANEGSKASPLDDTPHENDSKVEKIVCEKPFDTPKQSFSNFHCVFIDEK